MNFEEFKVLSELWYYQITRRIKNDHLLVIPNKDSVDNYTKLVQAFGTGIGSKIVLGSER